MAGIQIRKMMHQAGERGSTDAVRGRKVEGKGGGDADKE